MTPTAEPDDARVAVPAPCFIPDDVRAAIYAHALAVFPAECCGYLIGPRDSTAVSSAIRCTNAQVTGAHPIVPERGADTGFVIAGAELLAFARAFDSENPPRIVYHSHTNGRAYFSRIDREMADGPAYPVQHVVIGCVAGRVTEVAQLAWSEEARDHVEIARWSVGESP